MYFAARTMCAVRQPRPGLRSTAATSMANSHASRNCRGVGTEWGGGCVRAGGCRGCRGGGAGAGQQHSALGLLARGLLTGSTARHTRHNGAQSPTDRNQGFLGDSCVQLQLRKSHRAHPACLLHAATTSTGLLWPGPGGRSGLAANLVTIHPSAASPGRTAETTQPVARRPRPPSPCPCCSWPPASRQGYEGWCRGGGRTVAKQVRGMVVHKGGGGGGRRWVGGWVGGKSG